MAPRAQAPVLLLTAFAGRGRTSLLARRPALPELSGAALIAHSAPAQQNVRFIGARLAISAMRGATHSTGAHA